MFNLITGCYPPRPPQPEDISINGQTFTTFGSPLNHFTETDPELRTLVKRCLAYEPIHRPHLRDLLAIARRKVAAGHNSSDRYSEDDRTVRTWLRRAVYSAPIVQDTNPDPRDDEDPDDPDDPDDSDYVP